MTAGMFGDDSYAPPGLAAQSHRFPRLTPWATFFVRSADRFVSSQSQRGVYQRLYISRRNSWLFYRRMAFPATADISGDEFFRPAGAGRAIAFGSHGLRHGLHSCVRFADSVPGGREHYMQVNPAHIVLDRVRFADLCQAAVKIICRSGPHTVCSLASASRTSVTRHLTNTKTVDSRATPQGTQATHQLVRRAASKRPFSS